jgi:SAM-dependent methyltransferase
MKLYDELASWWPLLSPASEYEEEAAFYAETLAGACSGPVRSVLELGSGGGSNAFHLRKRFEMVLVEPSAGMRDVSRALNPGCEHVAGDMRTVRLGRAFDAVFVHDAVCYMTTLDDLRRAVETAFVHCRPGGAALFAPDFVREDFRPGTGHGGYDGVDRSLRYLEWVRDLDPSDSTYVVDYAFMMRGPGDAFRVEHDRHVEGLFSRTEWLQLLSEAGFVPRATPLVLSDLEPGTHEVFVATRPAAPLDPGPSRSV